MLCGAGLFKGQFPWLLGRPWVGRCAPSLRDAAKIWPAIQPNVRGENLCQQIQWSEPESTGKSRKKQNTHGGGIRDPLVISWPKGLAARGELRHGFHHATDLAPTLLALIGASKPDRLKGLDLLPFDGESFAPALRDEAAAARSRPQYFEMFGHRGIWADGWKAVAFHPRGQAFDDDVWELYQLDQDFNENHDLAAARPEQLQALVAQWWREAERCQVLPLDDRFGQRFAENGRRVQGHRRQFVMHAGMGHLPNDIAPDIRGRNYSIEADVSLPEGGAEGVLIAHGDATSGYSLYLQGGHLVHDLNIGGVHKVLRSDRPVTAGHHRLAVQVVLGAWVPYTCPMAGPIKVPEQRTATLLIDGEPVGSLVSPHGFNNFISWSGLDIGLDRGSPVSHYAAPFAFTGKLRRVTVTLDPLQVLDGDAVGQAEMARQ